MTADPENRHAAEVGEKHDEASKPVQPKGLLPISVRSCADLYSSEACGAPDFQHVRLQVQGDFIAPHLAQDLEMEEIVGNRL